MNCPECDGHLNTAGTGCKKCGWGKPERLTAGNGLPMWQSPGAYVKPNDDDVCGEWLPDGTLCQKTVRDHIEEFRALCAKPHTLLSRPSQREQRAYALPDEVALEARRQLLAEQARQLRAPASEPEGRGTR